MSPASLTSQRVYTLHDHQIHRVHFLRGFATRLVFLGIQPQRPGVIERDSLAELRRAPRHTHPLKHVPRLCRLRASRRHPVEDGQDGCAAGEDRHFNGRRDRLEIIDRRPAGDEHKVRGAGCCQGRLFGPGRWD